MSTQTTPAATAAPAQKAPVSRRKLRALGRKKRATLLRTNRDAAKTYFEGKSKRSADKKSAFRKKKSKKK